MAQFDWTRDELILALNLYFEVRPVAPGPNMERVRDLSTLLNGDAFHPRVGRRDNFRTPASVVMKLMNFRSIDPEYGGKGLSAGSMADRAVWGQFAGDRDRLRRVATAIRELAPVFAFPTEENAAFDIEGEEGKLLSHLHRLRERDPKLVTAKKREAGGANGGLICEVCGFSFAETYGARGADYVECHHLTALCDLNYERTVRLSDLALVCSNCHRMIHVKRPWLSLDELRSAIARQAGIERPDPRML